MNNELIIKFSKDLLIKFFEKSSLLLIGLIAQAFLARLLFPFEFGIFIQASLLVVLFGSILNNFFYSGIIFIDNMTKNEQKNLQYFLFILSVLFYLIILILMHFINSILLVQIPLSLIATVSLVLPFNALTSVKIALLHKDMKYKKTLILNMISVISGSLTSIIFAFQGFSYWSLAYGTLVQHLTLFILLLNFRTEGIKLDLKIISKTFTLSFYVFIYTLIENNLPTLKNFLFSSKYSSNLLGLYNKGIIIPTLLIEFVDGTINHVAYPLFASTKNNINAFKEYLRFFFNFSIFINFPLLIGIYSISFETIELIFSKNWLDSVPFFQAISLFYLFFPFSIFIQALNGLGKTKISFQFKISSLILNLVVIFTTFRLDILIMIYALLLSNSMISIIHLVIFAKILKFSSISYLKYVILVIFNSLIMYFAIGAFNFGNLPTIISLIFKICVGFLTYFILSLINNKHIVNLTIKLLKSAFQKSKT